MLNNNQLISLGKDAIDISPELEITGYQTIHLNTNNTEPGCILFTFEIIDTKQTAVLTISSDIAVITGLRGQRDIILSPDYLESKTKLERALDNLVIRELIHHSDEMEKELHPDLIKGMNISMMRKHKTASKASFVLILIFCVLSGYSANNFPQLGIITGMLTFLAILSFASLVFNLTLMFTLKFDKNV
tara:strand:+ start:694 stop:1260 length:567 start_codon:yes stop_codon:yes gene_type:complete